ncbi:nitrate assimilation regulatory protein nirA [Hirsutella rhossiliensis]|uniref:Nitrate assimilation regulatory protein nirA n=1 Tax=Hirsutella rhossiliensis TaxID=111463 RepID=A0A9P8N0M8_9HYPO|nr:nitrate assimilation regulatory protein nirA [Hirsutella rhossiliensis]KAH0962577.1 nitrate assimilation regulatory protein nirA [Hirsutella rhossiliensis]
MLIRMACQRCRKKRAKCDDGQAPCKRCDEAGEGRVYDHPRRKSKDDLRAEIDSLRRYNEEHDRLLRAICSINDVEVSNAFIQDLVEGTKSHQAILQELAHLNGENGRGSSDGGDFDTGPGGSCSPSLPFDDASHAQTDRWTCARCTVASVRQILDALLTWDYLPFCLMCKDPFFRDYCSGSSRYCSSALVNALIALATRVVHEISDEAESPGPGFKTGRSANLPDIQAIGILSLYQITCGREAEAQALADSFAARIVNLCPQEPLMGSEAEKYAKVWATSILRLTTGQVFTMSTSCKLQDDSIFLDQSACSAEYLFGGQCGSGTTPDPALKARGSQLRNLQLIPARVFQLTEWVYKLLSSATHTPNGRFDTAEVMAVYTECLDWYEGFFSLPKTGGSDTPFVLFIHMYYQFCLLCLFRPLANLVLADSDVRPREICLQAADSILTLSQPYSRLFTLRRVSPFVPYFLSLATISDVSSVDGFSTYQDVSPSPTAAKVPIMAHASQLLAEMSSNRRMASSIEKMLRGYLTELW